MRADQASEYDRILSDIKDDATVDWQVANPCSALLSAKAVA
jgi:hypothetical protein